MTTERKISKRYEAPHKLEFQAHVFTNNHTAIPVMLDNAWGGQLGRQQGMNWEHENCHADIATIETPQRIADAANAVKLARCSNLYDAMAVFAERLGYEKYSFQNEEYITAEWL